MNLFHDKFDEFLIIPGLDELIPLFKDEVELTLGALTPWTYYLKDDIKSVVIEMSDAVIVATAHSTSNSLAPNHNHPPLQP